MKRAAEEIPQDADSSVQKQLDEALGNVAPKWKNYIIRFVFTWFMIAVFAYIINKGPLGLIAIVVAVHVKCFSEVINIGYAVYRTDDLPWFRTLSWYMLIASSYFFYGETIIDSFGLILQKDDFLWPLITYHRFISFSMYNIGFVVFVLSLKKGYYFRQFSLFAWTHTALLILDVAAYCLISNIFEGMIWFIVPAFMIVINDVMAYMFGFFFGKTRLIKLSPKKTWEGYIGGAFSTVILSLILSYFMLQYKFFHCPVTVDADTGAFLMECKPSKSFEIQHYRILGLTWGVYPFFFHSLAMSLFCSIIGPFGGFFASGFKRACRIKDFGDVIPGHGGLMDRFDCQVMMAIFVNVYLKTFIRGATPQRIVQLINGMSEDDRRMVFSHLEESLKTAGYLKLEA